MTHLLLCCEPTCCGAAICVGSLSARPHDEEWTVDLRNKRVIAIGERDGIQGEVIRDVASVLGANVVFTITQCFV